MNLLEGLLEDVRQRQPQFPLEPLKKAFQVATDAHDKQTRKSGEPYIVHPVEVVRILLEMNVDLPSLVSGLLHDTVEDTSVSLEDLSKDFGEEVAFLVDGVTKLSKLSFKSKHTAQAENFRKMILAMGKDIRVILIKLADRLHNMRTLQHMAPHKQMIIAQETEEIYGPLANRLGIHWLKTELQDLSLRYLKPDVYFRLVELVAQSKGSREKYIQQVKDVFVGLLEEAGVANYEITGRPKHFYSIYKKMEKSQVTFEQIHDLLAFRVICEDIKSCYQILGIAHAKWKPVPGRFKDYIAMPKANLYQSLHTTVIGPHGQRIEIQIRTDEMHVVAEQGVAAHWSYKEDGSATQKDIKRFAWIQELVDEKNDLANQDPSEFLSNLKVDLFEEEVFIFTPDGDLKALPAGSTPVDFAYAIHSEVGDKCVGAKVNGRIVPLRHQLDSGDTIEIITSDGQSPRKDWLDFVVTTKARSKIRAFVKKAQREQARDMGLKLIEREFKKSKLNYSRVVKSMPNAAEHFRNAGCANEEDLLIKVGYGKILALDAFRALAKSMELAGVNTGEPAADTETSDKESAPASSRARRKTYDHKSPVLVDGIDNMLIRFAKCCNPIPGEPIIGFVSRGKGITVHRADCELALALDSDRKFDLDWDPGRQKDFKVGVRVSTVDKPGMLAEISQAISKHGANISNAKVQMHQDRRASILFEVLLPDLSSLQVLLSKIVAVDGVISAERCKF